MDALTFEVERKVCVAINSDGDLYNINSGDNNDNDILTYIPRKVRLCGKDSNGIIRPVLMDSNRKIFY